MLKLSRNIALRLCVISLIKILLNMSYLLLLKLLWYTSDPGTILLHHFLVSDLSKLSFSLLIHYKTFWHFNSPISMFIVNYAITHLNHCIWYYMLLVCLYEIYYIWKKDLLFKVVKAFISVQLATPSQLILYMTYNLIFFTAMKPTCL